MYNLLEHSGVSNFRVNCDSATFEVNRRPKHLCKKRNKELTYINIRLSFQRSFLSLRKVLSGISCYDDLASPAVRMLDAEVPGSISERTSLGNKLTYIVVWVVLWREFHCSGTHINGSSIVWHQIIDGLKKVGDGYCAFTFKKKLYEYNKFIRSGKRAAAAHITAWHQI